MAKAASVLMIRNIPDFFRRFNKEIIFICFTLWALYVRLIRLSQIEIDGDALWQMTFLSGIGSFAELLRNLPKADHAGYLAGDFILIYPFFKIFGWNKWALTFPHLVIFLAGFYFLYLLGRDHFKTVWGYVVAFLIFCLNDNLITHSVELRAYAVMPTLALMALYFSLQVVTKNIRLTLNEKFAAGTAFVVVIWFHLYGIFMVFCSALYALLCHSRDKDSRLIFKQTFKFFAVVFLITMPLWFYSVFLSQQANVKANFLARGISTFEYIPNPLSNPGSFLKAIFGNLMGFKFVYIFGLAVKARWIAYGPLLAFVLPQRDRLKQVGFFFILIVMPLQFLLLADLQNSYWFIQRQFVWVMAFYAFFLGWCWDTIAGYIIMWVDKLFFRKQWVRAN